jgi:hypothetical protein
MVLIFESGRYWRAKPNCESWCMASPAFYTPVMFAALPTS